MDPKPCAVSKQDRLKYLFTSLTSPTETGGKVTAITCGKDSIFGNFFWFQVSPVAGDTLYYSIDLTEATAPFLVETVLAARTANAVNFVVYSDEFGKVQYVTWQ
jgi:hypothetical protein